MARNKWTQALIRSAVPKAGLGNLLIQPKSSGGGKGPQVATRNVTWNSPGQPQILDQDAQAFGEDAYLNQVFVMRCVQTIANTIAGLEFRAGMDPENPSAHDATAPLAQLLGPATPQAPGGPNPELSSRAFWAWTICQYIVYGRFAWECQLDQKQIVALWPLVSACISAVPSRGGSAKYFDSYVYTTPMDGDIPMGADRVIYGWRPSLTDPRVPETVLSAAKLPIYIAKGLDRYMVKLLENDMVASTLVVTPPFAEASARRAWQEQFMTNFTGVDNKGKTIFAEADYDESDTSGKSLVQVEKIAQTAIEADLLTIGNAAKDEICVAIGVPLSLIGNACLKSDEYVRLADGSRQRAADMVGKDFEVLTSTENGPEVREAYASWNAVEHTYAVTTESGRRIMCNDNHPLFAATYTSTKAARWRSANGPRIDVKEWTRVRDLAVGDLLAVNTEFPAIEGKPYDMDAAKVLGYLIGDGSMTTRDGTVNGRSQAITFAAERSVHSDDLAKSVEALGDTVSRYKTKGVPVWGIAGGAVRKLLKTEGLMGTNSHTKFIPEGIWSASREIQHEFLSRLYATDGCASLGYVGRGKDARGHTSYGNATINYTSVSQQLAMDVQELLLRFGIPSRVSSGMGTLGIAKRRSLHYRVDITVANDVVRFCDEIGIFGKEEAIDSCREHAIGQIGRSRTPKWRTQQLNPGLRWEKIKSIEPLGIDATVCITVPDGHTYLGTFWEHNSQRIYANADSETRTFWTLTIMNVLTEFQDHINLRLAPRIGQEVGWFDLSRVAVLKPPSIFAPPMIGDVINFGVASAAQIANVLGIPAANATGDADTDTVELDVESSSTGAGNNGRSADAWYGTRITRHQMINARIRYEQRPINSHNYQEEFRASKWLEREHIDVRAVKTVPDRLQPEIRVRNAQAIEIVQRASQAKADFEMRQLEQRKARTLELVESTTRTAQEVRALKLADHVGKTVHKKLAEHYPESTLDWVGNADWTGPKQVDLSDIDMHQRPGGRDSKKVTGIAKGIVAGVGGAIAPVVLVKTPGSDKLKIADGYHRTKAHEKLGRKSLPAYIGQVDDEEGPWDREMHDKKLNRQQSMEIQHRFMTWESMEGHNSDGLSPKMTKEQFIHHMIDVHGVENLDTKATRDELDKQHLHDHNMNGECGAHEPDSRTDEAIPTLLVDDPPKPREPEIEPFSGTDFEAWLVRNGAALVELAESEPEAVNA